MSQYAVEMQGMVKVFGKNRAVDGVNLSVRKGSIHGLLGENGAGKTTLMNLLYGLHKPDAGEIYINGEHAKITSPQAAMRLGIGMVHQHFMLAGTLTVTENVMLGMKSRRGILLDTARVSSELKALSEHYGMDVDPNAVVRTLSVGQQQRVEILTALYMGADILILDEPTAVLTHSETEGFFETLREMRAEGKSVILITHKLDEILSVVDEVTVLRDGKRIAGCAVDGTVTRDMLSRLMVGRNIEFKHIHREINGNTVLSVENIHVKNDKGVYALSGLSLQLRAGEILGLAGVDGNGQKELCEALTGLRKIKRGAIYMDGVNVTGRHSADYIAMGITHVPEDRLSIGIAPGWNLMDNLIIKNMSSRRFSRFGILKRRAIAANWHSSRDRYGIKAVSGDDSIKSLSGGNQQKLILARELDGAPRVLIASQPTRGVDIAASEYVRGEILKAAENGTAVLLITADMEELLQLSDRIAVIYGGEIMGTLPDGADVAQIGAMMMGKRGE